MKNIKPFIQFLSCFLLLVMLNNYNYAQDQKLVNEPQIVGGKSALMQNVKYPLEALKNGTQGKVFIKATINKNGVAEKIELIKGNEILGKAAINAVKKTKFTAAKDKKGNLVNTEITIPVEFKLGGKR